MARDAHGRQPKTVVKIEKYATKWVVELPDGDVYHLHDDGHLDRDRRLSDGGVAHFKIEPSAVVGEDMTDQELASYGVLMQNPPVVGG